MASVASPLVSAIVTKLGLGSDRPFKPLAIVAPLSVRTMAPTKVFVNFLPVQSVCHASSCRVWTEASPPVYYFLTSQSIVAPFRIRVVTVPEPFVAFNVSSTLLWVLEPNFSAQQEPIVAKILPSMCLDIALVAPYLPSSVAIGFFAWPSSAEV